MRSRAPHPLISILWGSAAGISVIWLIRGEHRALAIVVLVVFTVWHSYITWKVRVRRRNAGSFVINSAPESKRIDEKKP